MNRNIIKRIENVIKKIEDFAKDLLNRKFGMEPLINTEECKEIISLPLFKKEGCTVCISHLVCGKYLKIVSSMLFTSFLGQEINDTHLNMILQEDTKDYPKFYIDMSDKDELKENSSNYIPEYFKKINLN